MHERIAAALLSAVCFEVSAIVSMGAEGEILGVSLFTTAYPGENLRAEENAREIWLISNHPEGGTAPYPQDLKNARRIVAEAKPACVRLFLCSEYFPCFETDAANM